MLLSTNHHRRIVTPPRTHSSSQASSGLYTPSKSSNVGRSEDNIKRTQVAETLAHLIDPVGRGSTKASNDHTLVVFGTTTTQEQVLAGIGAHLNEEPSDNNPSLGQNETPVANGDAHSGDMFDVNSHSSPAWQTVDGVDVLTPHDANHNGAGVEGSWMLKRWLADREDEKTYRLSKVTRREK